jgi:hypothetical protein
VPGQKLQAKELHKICPDGLVFEMLANVKRPSLLRQGKNYRQKSFIKWGISAWHFIPHFAYTFVKKKRGRRCDEGELQT